MNPIRVIKREDIDRVLHIYKPYILETASTFELEPPELGVFRERVLKTLENYPWLVFEEQGIIKGYCYAGPHRSRPAYQWSVESSVYIDKLYQGQSIGKRLYEKMLSLLKKQGFANVYAGITLPNDPSVAFHRSFGFQKIGTYEKVGYKMDQWRDVAWFVLRLTEDSSPKPPIPFSKLNISS